MKFYGKISLNYTEQHRSFGGVFCFVFFLVCFVAFGFICTVKEIDRKWGRRRERGSDTYHRSDPAKFN